jgi:hypothetical protein
MEVDRSSINDPESKRPQLVDLYLSLQSAGASFLWMVFDSPAAIVHVSAVTFPAVDFYDIIQRHYQIDKGSFSIQLSSLPVYPNELCLEDQAGLAHGMTNLSSRSRPEPFSRALF